LRGMKNVFIGFILLLSLGSCKKAIENAQREAVIDSITSGYWLVTKYIKGGTDLSGNFSTYKFQFKENNTVDAFKNNTLEKSGSWQTDVGSRTINANFVNATTPLTLLNGTWTITNSTWTSADATQTINGEVHQLRLDKQ
jgi:hypothetical protein